MQKKQMHKLTISRKRWVNGSNNGVSSAEKTRGQSSLLNEGNYMCCLGFLARSCGLNTKNIKCMGDPYNVFSNAQLISQGKAERLYKKISETPFGKLVEASHDEYNDLTIHDNTTLCNDLIDINDDNTISLKQREKDLKKEFKKINVDVEFVD